MQLPAKKGGAGGGNRWTNPYSVPSGDSPTSTAHRQTLQRRVNSRQSAGVLFSVIDLRKGGPRAAVLGAAWQLLTVPAVAQTNWGLATAGRDFYFTDLTRGQIVRLDTRDGLDVLIDDVHCHSLALDYGGTLYAEAVGDAAGGMGQTVALWRRPAGGTFAYAMAPTPRPTPGMWIARDAAGHSYSWQADGHHRSRIFRRAPDGSVSVLAGGAWGLRDGIGAGAQLGAVGAMAATAKGVLYLTDSGHLRRITPDGVVTTLAHDLVSERTGGIPGDFGLFNRTVGLAVGSDESVIIADVYNLRVIRWHAEQPAATLWDGKTLIARLTNGGLAWRPLGIAGGGRDIYVLASLTSPRFVAGLVGTPRILRVSRDGRVRTVFTYANRPLQLAAMLLPALMLSSFRRRIRRRRKSVHHAGRARSGPSYGPSH